MPAKKNTDQTNTFYTTGDELLKKIKELIHEGNIRKISILDKDKKVLMTFPVTVGVVGVALAPMLAAVGAIAAFLTQCSIVVEKES